MNRTGAIIGRTLKVGEVGRGNYTEIRPDGTMRRVGDATAWKDMVADLFGKRLLSTAGNVDYDWDNNAIAFGSGGSIGTANDRVQANLEINHEFRVGTAITFRPHYHWFQEIVSNAIVVAFVLTLEYRIQRNGQAMTTAWTTITSTAGVTNDIWDFTGEADGFYNQISRFPDIVVDCNVSDTLQMRVARTDSLGSTQLVYFLDMHGEIDSDGSDEEIAKAE